MTAAKTATAPAKKTPAPSKTTAAKTTAAKAKPDAITFRGRQIRVTKPTEGQLAVWQRLGKRYSGLSANPSEEEASRVFDRFMAIVESVMPETDDRDWLEDMMMAGQVDLSEAAEIVKLTVSLYFGDKATPSTGPAPKARRRR